MGIDRAAEHLSIPAMPPAAGPGKGRRARMTVPRPRFGTIFLCEAADKGYRGAVILSAGKSEQQAGVELERKPGFPHWTAGFFLSGQTEIQCAHRTYLLGKQQCLILPPNTPYHLRVQKREREVWMLFDPRPDWVSGLRNPECPSGVSLVTFPGRTWALPRRSLEELLEWWCANPPNVALAENAMERVLLLACQRRDSSSVEQLDERVQRVVQYIDNHLGEGVSVDTLAQVAALSPSRLAHLFKEQMRLSVMQHLEARRMEHAKQLLLSTNLSVKEVGARAGFCNPEHFCVRFTRWAGRSPKAFRANPPKRFAELNPEAGTP